MNILSTVLPWTATLLAVPEPPRCPVVRENCWGNCEPVDASIFMVFHEWSSLEKDLWPSRPLLDDRNAPGRTCSKRQLQIFIQTFLLAALSLRVFMNRPFIVLKWIYYHLGHSRTTKMHPREPVIGENCSLSPKYAFRRLNIHSFPWIIYF